MLATMMIPFPVTMLEFSSSSNGWARSRDPVAGDISTAVDTGVFRIGVQYFSAAAIFHDNPG